MRYRQPLLFPVSLDRRLTRPLWQQLSEQICSAVDAGVLAAGTRMPSTRTLATLLGVSRGVPVEAYELLFQSGYAASRPGSGTYVTVPARVPGAAAARSGASGAVALEGDGGVDLLPDQAGSASLLTGPGTTVQATSTPPWRWRNVAARCQARRRCSLRC